MTKTPTSPTHLADDGLATTRALERGLRVLETLMDEGPLGVTAVASAVGLAKSTTHRLLATLCMLGYVKALPDARYAFAGRASRLAGQMPRIQAELEYLRANTRETINLGLLVGREVQYVARALSDQALRWGIDVGHRVPAYCSGMGKAILAFRPDVRFAAGELPPRTERTITDPGALERDLAETRGRGYALDEEEFIRGVVCIAVPVSAQDGAVIGALSVSGPRMRFSPAQASGLAELLKRSADVISRLLDPPSSQDTARI